MGGGEAGGDRCRWRDRAVSLPVVDLVYSGGGTLVVCEIGAHARILESRRVARIAGTSAGAIIACAHAFGVSPPGMRSIAGEIFGARPILDRAWPWRWRPRFGIHKGDKILRLLRAHFPRKMGEARIPWGCFAYDLDYRRAVYFSSLSHPDMPAADVVRASLSIPAFFKAVRLPGCGDRLFIDGGLTANEPFDVFDDVPGRATLGVRFRAGDDHTPRRVGSSIDYVRSLLSGVYGAANAAHVSAKQWARVIQIETAGDSLDFSLSPSDLDRLHADGYQSASAYFERTDGNGAG